MLDQHNITIVVITRQTHLSEHLSPYVPKNHQTRVISIYLTCLIENMILFSRLEKLKRVIFRLQTVEVKQLTAVCVCVCVCVFSVLMTSCDTRC